PPYASAIATFTAFFLSTSPISPNPCSLSLHDALPIFDWSATGRIRHGELSSLLSCELPNQFQSMLPDHPAMLRIFVRNRSGCAQSERDLFLRVFAFGGIS